MEIIVIAAALWVIVFGVFGSWVAGECGRSRNEGELLGALFGPIGLVILALLPRSMKSPELKHQPRRRRSLHHNWSFWVGLVMMLGAMVIYVATMDEALGPGGKGQPVPAAAP